MPRGAMLLKRILASAPYDKAFMERVQQRSETLLAELRALDPDGFGIRLEHLALISEQIVIVPPLKAAEQRRNMENPCDDMRQDIEKMLAAAEADKRAALEELRRALIQATQWIPPKRKGKRQTRKP